MFRTTKPVDARAWRAALMSLSLLCFPATAKAETHGYIVSWLATATNAVDFKANCPEDRNKATLEWMIRDLMTVGYSKQEATDILARAPDTILLPDDVLLKLETRAIVAGKPASIYNYPDAVPDPDIETVVGKHAYGFDLGLPPGNKFVDPDTGAPVDNQLWRAVGCLDTHRAVPPEVPYGEVFATIGTGLDPAWALQITGEDLSKDGKVTLTLDRTTKRPERDATGGVLKNASYVIDDGIRSHNVFEGEIKNGVLSITPKAMRMVGWQYGELALRNTHMRIKFESDKLVGYWGGFINWKQYAFAYTSSPNGGADIVGIYHAIKRLADASPDPKTGQNQEISATFRMEAVPAFLFAGDGKVVAKPAPQKAPQLARSSP